MKDKATIKSFVQFLLGVIFALAFLTLLKFQNPSGTGIIMFLVCLVGMHAGIIFFILSKKSFRRKGIDIRKHYRDVMFYLLLFVPVLIYKFVIANIWKGAWIGDDPYMAVTLTLAGMVLILSVRSSIHLFKDIESDALNTDEPYEPKPGIFKRIFGKKSVGAKNGGEGEQE